MSELLPISLVAEYVYCPRSAWLSHNAGTFKANEYTVDGELVHRRVHSAGAEQREGRKQLRRVSLFSHRLGLIGYADLVEQDGDRYYPVEFKRGRVRENTTHHVQLCAQALCLEEMMHQHIDTAYMYYYESHQRVEVRLDPSLRKMTQRAIHELRDLLREPRPPAAAPSPRCRGCAHADACLPDIDAALAGFNWEDWQE